MEAVALCPYKVLLEKFRLRYAFGKRCSVPVALNACGCRSTIRLALKRASLQAQSRRFWRFCWIMGKIADAK